MTFVYIPESRGELIDFLSSMILSAPTFEDKTGYVHGRTVATEFHSLNESLLLLRRKLGEERYAELADLSAQARAVFDSDMDEWTKTRDGIALLLQIQKRLRRRK